MRTATSHHLHAAADGLELSAVTRRRELLPWLAFRFFHIRFVYNWAWDPDRFDWSPGATQYRILDQGRHLASTGALVRRSIASSTRAGTSSAGSESSPRRLRSRRP